MTDVEKYGLGAVVCVVVLLALVVLPLGGDEPVPVEGLARPAHPVIIGADDEPLATLSAATRQPARAHTQSRPERVAGRKAAETPATAYTVRPLTPQGVPFEWSEDAVAYPGRRSAAEPLAPGESRETITHVVAKGETLSDISARYFGTTTRWEAIRALNQGLDPKSLKPGQEIIVQTAGPPAGRAATPVVEPRAGKRASQGSYVVKEGDTLGVIAQKLLGSSRHIDELYEANRHVLESPDRLTVGQRLVIP